MAAFAILIVDQVQVDSGATGHFGERGARGGALGEDGVEFERRCSVGGGVMCSHVHRLPNASRGAEMGSPDGCEPQRVLASKN